MQKGATSKHIFDRKWFAIIYIYMKNYEAEKKATLPFLPSLSRSCMVW